MKTILITGIGGLTPRSIAKTIRRNHPGYKLIGIDVNKKAIGFFMKGLLDDYSVCPRCTDVEYFPFIERLVEEKGVDYALSSRKVKLLNGVITLKNAGNSRVLFSWDANRCQNR